MKQNQLIRVPPHELEQGMQSMIQQTKNMYKSWDHLDKAHTVLLQPIFNSNNDFALLLAGLAGSKIKKYKR